MRVFCCSRDNRLLPICFPPPDHKEILRWNCQSRPDFHTVLPVIDVDFVSIFIDGYINALCQLLVADDALMVNVLQLLIDADIAINSMAQPIAEVGGIQEVEAGILKIEESSYVNR